MERLVCALFVLAAAIPSCLCQADGCIQCWSGEICGASPGGNVSDACCECLGLASGSGNGSNCRERVSSLSNGSDCCTVAEYNIKSSFVNISNPTNETCTTENFFSSLPPSEGSTVMGPGDYIVQHFNFNCSGCIRAVQFLAVNSTTTQEDDILQFHFWKRYMNSTQWLYERVSMFPVKLRNLSSWTNFTLMRAEPVEQSNDSQACFDSGDVLGFSIAGENLILAGSVTTEFGERTVQLPLRNLSSCSNLSDLQLVSNNDGQSVEPIFGILLESSAPTTEPPRTTVTTPPPSDTSSTVTTTASPTASAIDGVPLYAIIVAIVGGIISILMLVVVIVMIVLVVKFHANRKTVDFSGRRPSFFQSFRRGRNSRNPKRSVSTVMSPRMEVLVNARRMPTAANAETVENHDYDAPNELLGHNYHVLEAPPNSIYAAEGYKYTTMYPPQSESNGHSMTANIDEDEAYHDPTELGSQHEITAKRLTVKNPLYSTSAGASEEMQAFQQQELHYDEPYELMKDLQHTPKTGHFYHVLEDPSEAVVAANKVYRSRSSSLAISLSLSSEDSDGGDLDPKRESGEQSSATADGPANMDMPVNHHYHLLEESMRSQSCGSLGSHHVFDSGVYVPNAEERERLAGEQGDISAQIYTTWTLAKRQDSSKKKQFFQSADKYWEPAVAEQQLYDQFNARKFREILRDQIEFKEHLGVGQFGSVCLAMLSSQSGGGSAKKVAVKTMKPSAQTDAKVKFLQEAAIMGQFFHSNVIKLFGVVTVGEPVMIVMELMALGDLANYLTKNYKPGMFEPPQPQTLLSFSRQVACGMKYLSKKSFVHRDLAARNILISETLICKVGDFGMSRDLKESNYYISSGGTVPIKWTAPEALHYKRYSTASDVYSYGMVLYEIWSLARKPLPDIAIPNVARMVSEGYCQPPPPGCPRKIYEVMVKCWNPSHEDRPSFSEVFEVLNTSDDSSLLGWSKEDRDVSPQVTVLGAPLSASWDLYLDLQLTHRRSKPEDA